MARPNDASQISYQWYKDGALLPGENKNVLLFPKVNASHNGLYMVRVSNSAGAVTSEARLTAIDALRLTQPLQNAVVSLGQAVTFTVVVTGAVDRYEWYFNNQLIDGANQPQLAIPATTAAHSGTYRVRAISNIVGAIESQATLTVITPPTVTTPVANLRVNELAPAILSVDTQGGGLTYKWFKNNVEIPGQTGAQLNLGAATYDIEGSYRVTVTNIAGSVSSVGSIAVTLVTNGITLYTRDCASCHGPITQSAKFNRTATQIKTAMQTVPAMQARFLNDTVVNRTDTQIANIASALVVTPIAITAQPASINITLLLRVRPPEHLQASNVRNTIGLS